MNMMTKTIKKARFEMDIRTLNSLSRVLILVVLSLGMSLLSPQFLTSRNIGNIITTASIPAILAIAQTIVILTGNIDLSIGSIFAIAGVTCGVLLKGGDIPAPYAILAGLAMGASLGFINGLLVAVVKLPPFIATYGVSFTAYGLASGILKGYVIYGFPNAFRFMGNGKFYGIPMPIILAVILVFLIWLLLDPHNFWPAGICAGCQCRSRTHVWDQYHGCSDIGLCSVWAHRRICRYCTNCSYQCC